MAAREVRCRNGHVVAEIAPEYAAAAAAAHASGGPSAARYGALDDLGVTCLACRVHLALGRDAELLQIRAATHAFLAAADARARAERREPLPDRAAHVAAGGLRMRCLRCHWPTVLLRRAADDKPQALHMCANCNMYAHYKLRNCVTKWY